MIGVIDSGVGGLTVVKELHKAYPDVDILFIGDSKNCPYGNKSEDLLLQLGNSMISYLQDKGVSQIVFGCNTLSTLVDRFDTTIKLNDLISPTVKYVTLNDIRDIGVLGTPATVKSNCYNILGRTRAQLSDVNLAYLIDNLQFNDSLSILDFQINQLKNIGCKTILLGCTHYPIIFNRDIYKDIDFIDPAQITACSCLVQDRSGAGEITLLTTGDIENYMLISKYINLKDVKEIQHITL